MVNDIITGISCKLDSLFEGKYPIYVESMEQGFHEPCFSVQLLSAAASPLLGTRMRRQYPFDILFFPRHGYANNMQMLQVAEILLQEMQDIDLQDGGILHGTSRRYEIVDDVLHFFVDYNLITYVPTEHITYQEDVGISSQVKG